MMAVARRLRAYIHNNTKKHKNTHCRHISAKGDPHDPAAACTPGGAA
jgi:hypothetical protein